MINKKLLMLAILLVSLLTVSAVSAADNATNDVISAEKTTNEFVIVGDNQETLKEDYVGSFTELAKEIRRAKNELNLTRDYQYMESDDSDYKKGIPINKKIIINGNGHTINGRYPYRDGVNVFEIGASNVVLKNINFIEFSDYAVKWNGDNGNLINCSFVRCSDSVKWSGENGKLINSSFTTSRGLQIYWIGDYGILNNCKFDNPNHLGYQFVSWGSRIDGGKYGTISNCTFVNCFGSSGCAIFSYFGSGNITNCSFVKCIGGAIYFSNSPWDISSCSFVNCSAESGGAIFCTQGGNCVISDCSFINCSAKYEGGAIYCSNDNSVVIESNFINCSAKEYGGGLYFTGKNCSLINPVFKFNTAPNGPDWYSLKDINYIKTLIPSVLIAPNLITTYNSGEKLVATLKDNKGKAIDGTKVKIVLNSITKILTTDTNGQVFVTTDSLIPKEYTVTITFTGDENYANSSTTTKIIINKLNSSLSANNVTCYYNSGEKLVVTLTDANGEVISGAKVTVKLGGSTGTLTTDAYGQALFSTDNLNPNNYTARITFDGDNIYKNSATSARVVVLKKEKSKIFLRNALYFVTQTKMVQVTLWDGNNQPLANKTVYIRAYDSVWHGVTDENGDAFVRVGIGFGTHDATVSFDGDDQYNASTRAGYIRVIKQTPSVMVRGVDTMFKATNPLKIVKVHLRDRYDQPLPEGSKIVLKLNGKTYIGFTDAEGVARIVIKIKTVGTFTAQAMYGGNTAYNPVIKDVKIRIV